MNPQVQKMSRGREKQKNVSGAGVNARARNCYSVTWLTDILNCNESPRVR